MDSDKILMRIAYVGTRYCGWQRQPNGLSIQEVIEKALATAVRKPMKIIGASRTDAGVHALAQAAHFTLPISCSLDTLQRALNGLLPQDIRITSLEPVSESFHARYSALSKQYHYHLWLEKTADPFLRPYRLHLSDSRFSLSALIEAAGYFVGTQDFAAFANLGGQVKSTVRTLFRLDSVEQEGGVRLEFEGDGFLYKMVRNIVGTLLEVALSKRTPSQIPQLLAQKKRPLVGAAAPAHGLFLVNVNYEPIPIIDLTSRLLLG